MKTHAMRLLLVLAVCAASFGAAQGKPTVHTVTIDATSFSPAQLTIKPGDSVVWRNKDMIPHTATASGRGGFDSGTLKPGDSWKYTFRNKGKAAYICSFHPTMKGNITVGP